MIANCLFRFVVNGKDRILSALSAVLWDSGNCHIMLATKQLQIMFQLICRKSTHLYTTTAGDRAGGKIKIKILRGYFGILGIHFKEVSHLIQDNIIWVMFFDVVISPYRWIGLLGFCGMCFFFLIFLILGLFLFAKIASIMDKISNDGSCFVPSQFHIGTVSLFISHAFSIMPFIAAYCAR